MHKNHVWNINPLFGWRWGVNFQKCVDLDISCSSKQKTALVIYCKPSTATPVGGSLGAEFLCRCRYFILFFEFISLSHTKWGGVCCMIFLCRSGYFIQLLANNFLWYLILYLHLSPAHTLRGSIAKKIDRN